jgi:hypothetical protein
MKIIFIFSMLLNRILDKLAWSPLFPLPEAVRRLSY